MAEENTPVAGSERDAELGSDLEEKSVAEEGLVNGKDNAWKTAFAPSVWYEVCSNISEAPISMGPTPGHETERPITKEPELLELVVCRLTGPRFEGEMRPGKPDWAQKTEVLRERRDGLWEWQTLKKDEPVCEPSLRVFVASINDEAWKIRKHFEE